MKHSFLAVLSASLFLTACGGGSSEPVQDHSRDVKAALPALIDQYVTTAPKPFTGAFMIVEGQSIGYINATSPRAAVELVARTVLADTTQWTTLYQAMLSDKGMKVEVVGESTGKSSITGLTMYAPNMVYVVKMMKDGSVVISGQ